MKTKKHKYLVSVPDGSIPHMNDSWADNWINIFDNGGIGYQGCQLPTETEKKDIRKRIGKLQDLLNERQKKLQEAWYLMQ